MRLYCFNGLLKTSMKRDKIRKRKRKLIAVDAETSLEQGYSTPTTRYYGLYKGEETIDFITKEEYENFIENQKKREERQN
jgi:hypothetical protein